MDTFLALLNDCVGTANVLTTAESMAPFLADWRGRYHGRARAVVKPANTAEVAAVVCLCQKMGIPMVPQGGNTGLCGGATPPENGHAVVISLLRMQAIRAVDSVNNTLCAEAGTTLSDIQLAASEAGRFFPLSLASEGSCQLGGVLSTNAGGVHVLRYGTMRDLTLGLECVLPDGQVWSSLKGLRKDNTGYDLKHLFIGAEGTLGIVTAAVVKLFPAPRRWATAWVAVPDPAAAVTLLAQMQSQLGERICAFELVGEMALNLVLKHIPDCRCPLTEPGAWNVLVECSDTLEEEGLDEALERALAVAIEADIVSDAVVACSLSQRQAFWSLREHISEAQRIEGVSIKHDISVPVSTIPVFLDRAERALERLYPGTRIVVFGHIGDGNLHYNLSQAEQSDNAGFIARTEEINGIVHDLVDTLNGSISAEHGLGQLKRKEILRYKSALEVGLMREIKRVFDPHALMNPGKVL